MYELGIDMGTTRTAAAVLEDGQPSVVTFGMDAATVPSAVFVSEDGSVLVGEQALRRGAADPTRLAREFKRRVGDPEPMILGGTPWSASALTARLLGSVLEEVCERQGEKPQRVTLTHPANWGPYKTDLLQEAARLCGLDDVQLLSEPEAAALHYGTRTRVLAGSTVAVYDLGGGTFDATVLRKGIEGFQTVGTPEGLERFGGVDIDAAVRAHVRRILGDELRLDPEDPRAVAAMGRLHEECVRAKEALSVDLDVSIPVMLPGLATEVRLTRAELEGMVAPALADTVTALRRTLKSAGVGAADLAAVLLVGGGSRMPLVTRLVTDELNRPVAVDAHPKHAVALGAVLAGGEAAAESANHLSAECLGTKPGMTSDPTTQPGPVSLPPRLNGGPAWPAAPATDGLGSERARQYQPGIAGSSPAGIGKAADSVGSTAGSGIPKATKRPDHQRLLLVLAALTGAVLLVLGIVMAVIASQNQPVGPAATTSLGGSR